MTKYIFTKQCTLFISISFVFKLWGLFIDALRIHHFLVTIDCTFHFSFLARASIGFALSLAATQFHHFLWKFVHAFSWNHDSITFFPAVVTSIQERVVSEKSDGITHSIVTPSEMSTDDRRCWGELV